MAIAYAEVPHPSLRGGVGVGYWSWTFDPLLKFELFFLNAGSLEQDDLSLAAINLHSVLFFWPLSE